MRQRRGPSPGVTMGSRIITCCLLDHKSRPRGDRAGPAGDRGEPAVFWTTNQDPAAGPASPGGGTAAPAVFWTTNQDSAVFRLRCGRAFLLLLSSGPQIKTPRLAQRLQVVVQQRLLSSGPQIKTPRFSGFGVVVRFFFCCLLDHKSRPRGWPSVSRWWYSSACCLLDHKSRLRGFPASVWSCVSSSAVFWTTNQDPAVRHVRRDRRGPRLLSSGPQIKTPRT